MYALPAVNLQNSFFICKVILYRAQDFLPLHDMEIRLALFPLKQSLSSAEVYILPQGGLAAPALAAVAGTALTTVGGAAAATTITGIMGSTVGAAALIAGFGAGGAKFVGGKMARRIGKFP